MDGKRSYQNKSPRLNSAPFKIVAGSNGMTLGRYHQHDNVQVRDTLLVTGWLLCLRYNVPEFFSTK